MRKMTAEEVIAMECKWESNFTGEVYGSLYHAVTTIIRDMIHYKSCRTIKAFDIRRR